MSNQKIEQLENEIKSIKYKIQAQSQAINEILSSNINLKAHEMVLLDKITNLETELAKREVV